MLVSLLYVFVVVAEGKWWWPVVMDAAIELSKLADEQEAKRKSSQ